MKKAVGYIRVSTSAQADDDSYGLDLQREAIEKYAGEHDYEIVLWYKDTVSGVKDDRPGWGSLINDDGLIQNPPYEAVIVFKNDRVARDTKLYFYYLYRLERRGVKLLSVMEQFEDDAMANVYRSLMMFVAEQERKNINMRTMRGRAQKAANGGYCGGRAPYGYSISDGNYKIVPEEAEVVKRIFEDRENGMSVNGIAMKLNMEGIRKRNGGMWGASGVNSILLNKPTYMGYYKYRGQETFVDGIHETILDGDMTQEELRNWKKSGELYK